MSLKEELEGLMAKEDKLLEMSTEVTFGKLSSADQDALRAFFQRWGEANQRLPASLVDSAGLIALGFILGHNWVKDHWALW